ncbi:MAG: hypothetical protein LBL60_03655 [Mycoplasmataceae bacterium]|jgi:hypothetical protein|nr:hypothetical protein [Mycoplasmataceae bacterium]
MKKTNTLFLKELNWVQIIFLDQLKKEQNSFSYEEIYDKIKYESELDINYWIPAFEYVTGKNFKFVVEKEKNINTQPPQKQNQYQNNTEVHQMYYFGKSHFFKKMWFILFIFSLCFVIILTLVGILSNNTPSLWVSYFFDVLCGVSFTFFIVFLILEYCFGNLWDLKSVKDK